MLLALFATISIFFWYSKSFIFFCFFSDDFKSIYGVLRFLIHFRHFRHDISLTASIVTITTVTKPRLSHVSKILVDFLIVSCDSVGSLSASSCWNFLFLSLSILNKILAGGLNIARQIQVPLVIVRIVSFISHISCFLCSIAHVR